MLDEIWIPTWVLIGWFLRAGFDYLLRRLEYRYRWSCPECAFSIKTNDYELVERFRKTHIHN